MSDPAFNPFPDGQERNAAPKRYYGKYPAVVKQVEATDGKHRGYIQVEVPSIVIDDGNGKPQALLVMAMPCLPPGFFIMPEIEDRVWVEFLDGELRYPIWVGVWYSESNLPPKTADEAEPTQKQKVIRTLGKHVITFDDEKGTITIRDNGQNKIVLSGDGQIRIEHASKAFINIDEKGSVLISNAKGSHLNLDADQGAAVLWDENSNIVSLSKEEVLLTNGKKASITLKDDQVAIAAPEVVVQGAKIALGDPATAEPTLMGRTFSMVWMQLITALMTHIHPTGMGPSGPSPDLIAAVTPLMNLMPGVHLTGGVSVK